MRIDSTTVVAIVLIIYGVFVAITATNLYAANILDQRMLEIYQTTGLFISVLALAYIVYHSVLDQTRRIRSYEERNFQMDLPTVLISLLAIAFPVALSQFASPVENPVVAFLISILGLSPILIALAENYFYIGVVGDYVYDRTNSWLVASLAVGALAVMFHLALKVAYPYYNLPALFLQFFVWTWASIKDESTLPADIGHLMNNALASIL